MFAKTETTKFATPAEARAIVDRARALRAEAMGAMLRAAWARLALRRSADGPGRMSAPMPARA